MLDRHIAILDLLASRRRSLGATEIAEGADLPISTTYRLLRELQQAKLIDHRDGGDYWLGLKCLVYGGAVLEGMNVRDAAIPTMRRLSETTQETVYLTMPDGDYGIFVEKVESSAYYLRWHIEIGHRVPLYAGASMKVLLAFLDDSHRAEVMKRMALEPLAKGTIGDPQRLDQELELIRSRGWARSAEEMNEEAAGISAPIWGRSGEIAAGLTISGAAARFTDDRIPEMTGLVCAGAAEISRTLGFVTPAIVKTSTVPAPRSER